MEYFDIVNEDGETTGKTVSREKAHRDGILHRTTHVWLVRKDGRGGYQILLQKRSGDEPKASALRELKEELGITATDRQLAYAGRFRIQYEKVFHGRLFRDNEVAEVYVYTEPVEAERLILQESEVEEVRWFDLEEVWEELDRSSERFCVPKQSLGLLRDWLAAAQ